LDKSSGSKSLLSVQTIVLAEVAWAVLALLFFLLFSVTPQGQDRPVWYSLGTSVFEAVAYLGAAILCFRNWRSPQIVSGRNVWLGIGSGMALYFVGSVLFSIWETALGLDAAVSPGDFFFLLAYIFLIWGMVSAVASRRLNLEVWQWGLVAFIAAAGVAFAIYLSNTPTASNPQSSQPQSLFMPAAIAQTAPPASPAAKPSPKVPAAKASPKASPTTAKPKPTTTPKASPSPTPVEKASPEKPVEKVAPVPTAPAATKAPESSAQEWAKELANVLEPLAAPINLAYLVFDVVLLILAMMLLLAFWGGRFSQSWRMIAAAAFSYYIADMWFKYASRDPNYQSGGLLEVFWVFSGVLFGIGAALEYDVSSRSRTRASGRKRPS